MKYIIFGGGCFWGVEAYFQRITGVEDTEVGYANSNVPYPSYENVCGGITGSVEAVKIEYQEEVIALHVLLEQFMSIINPYSYNRQGNDIGTQYRTGAYTLEEESLVIIKNWMKEYEQKEGKSIAVEIMPCINFYPAEEYHQNYLQKNPMGYCHIDINAVPAHIKKN